MSVALLVLRRFFALVITLLIASMVIFGALYLAPGDPATFLAGGHDTSPAVIAEIRAQYHLDQPLPERYLHWLGGVLHGDLGRSIIFNEPVAHLLSARLVTSTTLVLYALVLVVVIGVLAGVASALRGRLVDTVVGSVAALAAAVPPFVIALVLITVFGVRLGWFPVVGGGSGFASRLHHLTLPALSLALAQCAYLTQITRASVRAANGAEYADTARVRGLPPSVYLRKHVLRNALIPITTASGLVLAALIAGDAVIEHAFGINGVGSYLIESVTQKDFPVVQAICLILVGFFVVTNTLIDLLHLALDPRLSAAGDRP